MICKKCGAANNSESSYCEYCGEPLTVTEEQENGYQNESNNGEYHTEVVSDNEGDQSSVVAEPAKRLHQNYSLLKYIVFGILTLGIYDIVVLSSMSTNINIVASRYDGRKTMHYCLLVFLISWLTLGIGILVWYHRFSERVGYELIRRKLNYSFGAGTFWLWGVLGCLIIIGPLIYIYKLCNAMNKLDEDYNIHGC